MDTEFNCPACQSKAVVFIHKIEKLPAILFPVDLTQTHEVPLRPIKLYECENCRHLFQSHWDDAFIKLIYEEWYCYYPFLSGESMVGSYRKPFEDFMVDVLGGGIKHENTSLLEIGCGNETQLEIFLEFGLNVTSINPTIPLSRKVKFIQGYYGSTIINGRFDIIVSRFSLEHVTNVSLFFSELRNNLNENGSAIIQVPNAQYSIQSGLLNIFAHEHIHYFNLISLTAMANANGFVVAKIHGVDGPSLICKLVRKKSVGVREYIEKSSQTAEAVISLIRQANEKVLIYGAGMSMSKMLYEADLLPFQDKLVLVDDNRCVDGKAMPGMDIPIQDFSVRSLENISDIIVTLNPIYQKSILEKITLCSPNVNVFKIDRNGLSKIEF
jgi:SAM-dependent methyltransferase